VREEKVVDAKAAPSSTAKSPASTASVSADDAPMRVKMIIVIIATPIRRLTAATAAETTPDCLSLLRQEGA
jgi:uncharacterized protein YgbK (DUF1537 family)